MRLATPLAFMIVLCFGMALGAVITLSAQPGSGDTSSTDKNNTPFETFELSTFEALLSADSSFVVHVHADWCAFCRAQSPTLAALGSDTRFEELQLLRVEFDQQRDALARLGVNHQSTLIAFHQGHEVDRLIGDTDPERIEALFLAALEDTESTP
ncbi:thioredoxin family protein [Gammaproteobacteria bacterium AB-CW1]|uniref:Thioredoxin family protein n=1 Tax=Natronospira elongata TaxID=3110268 RepID=A0AAP6JHI2_9GAMM|nr:thioredoxin family protein [Gammaproteobacteria bacterium AB-CW1]